MMHKFYNCDKLFLNIIGYGHNKKKENIGDI